MVSVASHTETGSHCLNAMLKSLFESHKIKKKRSHFSNPGQKAPELFTLIAT